MTTARLAALAALFALAATSAFGGECCQGDVSGYGYGAGYGHGAGYGPASLPTMQGYGQPGGFANRIGNPYYYSATNAYGHAAPGHHGPAGGSGYGYGYGAGGGGDVYSTHFGPGFHRNGQSGHYRFPYYSYRRPWYHVGPPAYAADTNLPW